ncbi:MAG: hypothetical protein ACF788_11245, partial [Novipirellula sp. JB048]
GVTQAQWLQYSATHGEPTTGEDFQRLANQMGVEAIVVGSVTDFQAYYPPRMAMTVHWYAANEGFHPVPAGYGLPWGTPQEKAIPRRIVREAEFELARSQLQTQTPLTADRPVAIAGNELQRVAAETESSDSSSLEFAAPEPGERPRGGAAMAEEVGLGWFDDSQHDVSFAEAPFAEVPFPADWPDPTDLIPDPPSPLRPAAIVNRDPVLSHTRIYRGDDAYFTNRLADYVETNDDARSGGWQGYLKRSDDFIRFCCHVHISEMLESRGGSDTRDLILRWPLSRY